MVYAARVIFFRRPLLSEKLIERTVDKREKLPIADNTARVTVYGRQNLRLRKDEMEHISMKTCTKAVIEN
ncbi:hypothetical protein JTB14_019782 [Gonioctena quinquepunctata]|nr:hypothetical protein JTB14_019782 [Gonioctena quinquepunctata]